MTLINFTFHITFHIELFGKPFLRNEQLTRRERLKSAPYLRLKKREKNFWKKIEIFEKFFSFKKSRIVPKNVKGGSFWIY